MPFDRKRLGRLDGFPSEVACFCKCSHFISLGRECSYSVTKFPDKELIVGAIANRLELAHIDIVLFDERLDLARAPSRALKGRIKPIVQRLRLQPLSRGAARLALV